MDVTGDEEVDSEVTLYTTADVAKLVQVSPETVRNWLNEGKLKGVRLESAWRIRRSDLISFLEERYA